MGFFSKKITTDKITESLLGFFDSGYSSLINGFEDLLKKKQESINKEQNKELLVIPMLAIIRAVLAAFRDTPKTKNIIGKFQQDIFNKYFTDAEEGKQFGELFWERCDEYSKILNSENKDLDVRFSQIFCTHFFGKEEDGSHLAIMTFIGGSFFNEMINIKKFLDEVLFKFEVI